MENLLMMSSLFMLDLDHVILITIIIINEHFTMSWQQYGDLKINVTGQSQAITMPEIIIV